MFTIPAKMHQIYDGEGRHIGGMFPPLMVNRALTPHFRKLAAERPAMRRISMGKRGAPGLTWMIYSRLRTYPGLQLRNALPEPFAAIVEALEAGLTVDIYGDDHPAVKELADAAIAAVRDRQAQHVERHH